MAIDDLNTTGFLGELYRQTGGDAELQVSMYQVGSAIGLDRAEAGNLAEQLIIQGQAELRTLAGGISITADGLAALGISLATTHAAAGNIRLSDGPVADDSDRRSVLTLTEQIKNDLVGHNLHYDRLEEIVLDLKTIEVQMLSPRPKIAVIREIFRSLRDSLATAEISKSAALLKSVLG